MKRNFYPMRPSVTGLRPDCAWLAENRGEFIIQPKLNGDRVCLWVEANGGTYAQHRKGGAYSFRIRNAGAFTKLPAGTVLDGEVLGSNFYPFEVVQFGDLDLSGMGVEHRAKLAEMACHWCGVEWLFAEPTAAQLAQWEADWPATRRVEGVVIKRRGCRYLPHSRVFHESHDWFKLKWC